VPAPSSRPETLAALGEKTFLSRVLPDLFVDPRLLSGFGHDAAVIELPDAPFNLIQKIDRASYPVSLKKGWSGYDAWGKMAVTANCSDVLASGGEPLACMIAIMVPGEETAEHTRDIILGAAGECRTNGIVYAGGDLKEAQDPHVVGACIGIIPKDGFLPRNTAQPGDSLYCAGLVGGFAGAYFLLKNAAHDARTGELSRYKDYLASPVAQWGVARRMNATGLARCGMDASDGILDVLQTFASPGVRLELDLDRIPYHPFAVECARRTGIPITQLIFGGGDWNILYTIPKDAATTVCQAVGQALPLFHIGEVVEGDGVWAVAGDGERLPIVGVINEHFVNRIEDAGGFMNQIENGDFIHGIRDGR
jgi:thiamine-monophosphate kinase